MTAIPDFVFSRDSAIPAGSFVEENLLIPNTPAADNNLGAGTCRLKFDFYSDEYFTHNPGAHIAVVLRLDHHAATVLRHIRGAGIVMGNVSGYYGGRGNPLWPSAQVEAWWRGVHPDPDNGNDLIPESSWPGIFTDAVRYTIIIDSIITTDNRSRTRYQILHLDELLFDSGEIDDGNKYFDWTKTGIGFGHVFSNPAAPEWGMIFSNISVEWIKAPPPPKRKSKKKDRTGVILAVVSLIVAALWWVNH